VVACCLAVIGVMTLMRPAGATAGVLNLPPPTKVLASSQVPVTGIDTGACISYPATGGQSGKTIFIDAGHGGLDPGVVGSAGGKQVLEKDATLAVATRLGALLRADGYGVVMARTQDSSVTRLAASDSITGALTNSAEHRDLVTRAACANASNASVLVSIHFDGFSDPSVGGTETFYDSARPFAATSKRLAADLQAGLVSGLGTSDRGVWTDDQLAAPALTSSGNSYGHLIELGPASAGWVDDPSQMPGALVEPLFITNPTQAAIASDPAGQQRIAQAMEAGLIKFFSGA
jgi:N-acetylmuramoyl-L-alanine amidase